MGRKDRVIIVNETALRRREAKQRKKKKIIGMVAGVTAVVAIAAGVILVKNIVSSSKNDSKQEVESQQSAQDAEGTTGTEQAGTETEVKEEAAVEYDKLESKEKVKFVNGVAVVGNSAYELFTYRESSAKAYAKAVNALAKDLDGKAEVYDMVIPLSSGITFPDNLVDKIDSTNQRDAMLSIMGMMNSQVKSVDIYDVLMKHRKEYIYFRTDHHWTALGAYYAYTALCEEMGIEPEKLEEYETREFEGFVGSFYNDTKNESLKKHPDVITAYLPKSEAKMHVTPAKGQDYDWDIIYDVSAYGASLKYSTFIASDNPFTEITNQTLTDESSCIVVKESFGNAFVPFLVDHYQHVYVVDYRYWQGNLAKLTEEKKAKDVILLNNLSMIRNQYLVGQLQGVMK